MSTAVLTRGSSGGGGRSFGGFRSSFGRSSSGRTSRFGGSSGTRVIGRGSSRTTIIHNHVYAPRVYGGRRYVFVDHGFGYGYYGPHPVFVNWYGYPCYYGWPGHWSGWDWAWGPLAWLGVLAVIFGFLALIAAMADA